MCYKQNTDRKGEMQLNRKLEKYIAQLARVGSSEVVVVRYCSELQFSSSQ